MKKIRCGIKCPVMKLWVKLQLPKPTGPPCRSINIQVNRIKVNTWSPSNINKVTPHCWLMQTREADQRAVNSRLKSWNIQVFSVHTCTIWRHISTTWELRCHRFIVKNVTEWNMLNIKRRKNEAFKMSPVCESL